MMWYIYSYRVGKGVRLMRRLFGVVMFSAVFFTGQVLVLGANTVPGKVDEGAQNNGAQGDIEDGAKHN